MDKRNHGLAIICFNRAELLERCILSMFNAAESTSYTRILFQQLGNDEVSKVIERYRSNFDHVILNDVLPLAIDKAVKLATHFIAL